MGAMSDLDDCLPGVDAYSIITSHTPQEGTYGLCVTFANSGSPYGVDYGWIIQLALPTVGFLKFRRKINKDSWSSWVSPCP